VPRCVAGGAIEPSDLPQYHPGLPSPLDDKELFPTQEDAIKAVVHAERSRTYHKLVEGFYRKYAGGGNFWLPRMFVQRGEDRASNKYSVITLVCITDVEDGKRLLKEHVQKSYMQSQMFFGKGTFRSFSNFSTQSSLQPSVRTNERVARD
jgi:hypothetical protein